MSLWSIDLTGKWSLEGTSRPGAYRQGHLEITADVPGNIELDLMNNGITEDLFFADNARKIRDFEYYKWTYSRKFHCTAIPAAADLVMEGIDCLAVIFINGKEVGRTANACRIHRLAAAHLLREGENSIVIEIWPPMEKLHDMDMEGGMLSGYPMNHAILRFRKPAHSWGWDILPRLPLGGIFRDIRLEEVTECRIVEDRMQLLRIHPGNTGELIYQYKIANGHRECRNMRLVIDAVCGDSRWHHEDAIWAPVGWTFIMAQNIRLWWPRGYGDANVYDISVKILQDDIVIAEKNFSFGMRLVKVMRKEIATGDEPAFQLLINDRKIRIHGTNHIPADALFSRNYKRLPDLLHAMTDMNCNMVRVWGGGNYECDEFYDYCDRAGIMIWHDFMMACGAYPRDEEFMQEFAAEAAAALRRLRHHPAIVVWAGDNECDGSYALMLGDDPANNTLTRKLLPDICSRHDPGRPFLKSSPEYTPAAYALNPGFPELNCADQHLWGARDYYKSDFYRMSKASLSSEVGYPGCPSVSSLKKFLPDDALWPPENELWIYHAANVFYPDNHFNDFRIKLLTKHIKMLFGFEAENIEDFALASQICQAEALKSIVESFRTDPARTGVMVWNLSDGWPLFGEGCIDYYGCRKLAYYYLRRSQQDFFITLDQSVNWQRGVIIVNDCRQEKNGICRISSADNGRCITEFRFSAAANSIKHVKGFEDNVSVQDIYLIRWETDDGCSGCNHFLSGMPVYDFGTYSRKWLNAVAAMDDSFDPTIIAR